MIKEIDVYFTDLLKRLGVFPRKHDQKLKNKIYSFVGLERKEPILGQPL